jgi:hypothetical protein
MVEASHVTNSLCDRSNIHIGPRGCHFAAQWPFPPWRSHVTFADTLDSILHVNRAITVSTISVARQGKTNQ